MDGFGHPEDIDLIDGKEIFVGKFGKGLVDEHSGIVDEDIYRGEFLFHQADEPIGVVVLAYVELQWKQVAVWVIFHRFLLQFLQLAQVSGYGDDLVFLLFGKVKGGLIAYTAAGPGYNNVHADLVLCFESTKLHIIKLKPNAMNLIFSIFALSFNTPMKSQNTISKLFVALLFALFVGNTVHAQPELDSTKRWYFGGNLGAQFGSETFIEVSPLVGYRITENFSIGAGITYIYFSQQNPYNPAYSYHSNIYGARLFAKEYLIKNFFAYGEEELLNLEEPNFNGDLVRTDVGSTLVGGGFSQSMGGNALSYLMILWNLNETPYSPYTSPIIRLGFTF